MMYACRKGHEVVVTQLIEARADVNAKNDKGETAFDIAKASGNTEIASMLENARISADEIAGSAFSP